MQIVWEALPGDLDKDVIEDSLRHLVGIHPTKALYLETCWRLAGNLPRLALRRAVPPWHAQRVREWVPMVVTGCRRCLSDRGDRGALFSFRILGGTPCPRIVQKWLSFKVCRILAKNTGFNPRQHRTRYPFTDPRQLVGLRLYGLVEPDLCSREPGFEIPLAPHPKSNVIQPSPRVFPATVREYNIIMVKRTFRCDPGYGCPEGFPMTFPCQLCPVGFLRCKAGKHRKDWRRRACTQCERKDAFFDDELSKEMCVDCFNKQAYRRQ